MEYWLHIDGDTQGPFSADEIREKAQPTTLVSHGSEWIALASHPDFGSSAPPPPPPHAAVVASQVGLDVNSFRADKETLFLFVSIAILSIGIFIFTTFSLGFVALLLALGIVFVMIQQGKLLGGCVKVSATQLPRVHGLCQTAAQRLRMAMPDVFVLQDPNINAFAIGIFDRKSVVLNSATVEAMTDDELLSIIGHEFTHIKAGHTSWTVLIGQASGIGIPILSNIIEFIFLGWSRKAEYTADRGSLISSRNVAASVTALAKLAVGKALFEQMNLESFLQQKMEVDQDDVSRLSENLATHPYITNRIHGLIEFSRSPVFLQLTNRD